MRETIVNALKAKYEGQKLEALANVEVYLTNPAGIGEHPDVVEAVDSQIAKFAEAEEKLEALKIFSEW